MAASGFWPSSAPPFGGPEAKPEDSPPAAREPAAPSCCSMTVKSTDADAPSIYGLKTPNCRPRAERRGRGYDLRIMDGVEIPRAYFAFGPNMDEDRMKARCPGAVPGRPARFLGHRFLFNSRSNPTLVARPGAVVHGVLWSVTPMAESVLDLHAHVANGERQKAEIGVVVGDGEEVKAFAYVDPETTPGSPRPGYLELVIAAARRRGLPADYVRELESLLVAKP